VEYYLFKTVNMSEFLISKSQFLNNIKSLISKYKTVVLLVMALVVLVGIVGIWGWKGRGGQLAESQRVANTSEDRSLKEIVVGEQKLLVEMAVTPGELEKGLGDREELGSDGMLFVMPYRTTPEFWMKGMRFGLDFVWIDCGGQRNSETEQQQNNTCEVMEVTENVAAPKNDDEYLPRYYPSKPVTHVLEVNAGWVSEHGVRVGDAVLL